MVARWNVFAVLTLTLLIFLSYIYLRPKSLSIITSYITKVSKEQQHIQPYSWNDPIPNEANILCVKSKTNPSFSICIHDPKVDRYVSGSIAGQGIWENHHIRVLLDELSKFGKNMTFVNVGANIGFHAFYAAALGMKVIAVEPNKVNHPLFHKSVKLNDFESKVILLPYVMSETRKTFQMRTEESNLGNTFIRSDRIKIKKELEHFNVTSILLDDILPFIKTKTAILMVDVQGHECGVILGGKTFFKKIYVPELILEMGVTTWADPNCLKNMIDMLLKLGYTNVIDAFSRKTLNPRNTKSNGWPMDTLWSLDEKMNQR